MTMTRPTTEQITHNGRLLSKNLSGFVTPEEFGAVGDGVANDTAALQAALDTLQDVRGTPGKTYLVRRAGNNKYCLLWKTGMRWHGCGSVIKLADNEITGDLGCAVLMTIGSDTSIGTMTYDTYFEGTVDGNTFNQTGTIPGTVFSNWFTATLHVNYIARTEWHVRVFNFHCCAFYAEVSGSDANTQNKLTSFVENGRGVAVRVRGSFWDIPSISTINASWVDNNALQGNLAVFSSLKDAIIGRLYGNKSGFGFKFQGTSERITLNSCIVDGDNGALAGGLRFSDGVHRDISVGNVVVNKVRNNCLQILGCENVSICSYVGNENSDASYIGSGGEVIVAASRNISIGSIVCRQSKSHIFQLSSGGSTPFRTDNVDVGSIVAYESPNLVGYVLALAGSGVPRPSLRIGRIGMFSDASGWSAPITDNCANTHLQIGLVSIDVLVDNYLAAGTPLFKLGGSFNGSVRCGPVNFRNRRTSGVVQLSSNATTTSVPITVAPVMTSSNDSDFAPLLRVEPVSSNGNDNAQDLLAGKLSISAGDQTTGGLTIRHPPVSSTTFVRWTVDGYVAPSGALASTSASSLKSNVNATAAAIADKDVFPNLGSKYEGMLVWDTTNNRMMYASGSTDVSPWYVIDGSASVTPS